MPAGNTALLVFRLHRFLCRPLRWIFRCLLDQAEPFFAYQSAERAYQQPVKEKALPAGTVKAVHPCFRGDANTAVALGKEGDVAYSLGKSGSVERDKGLGLDALNRWNRRPEASDQSKNQLPGRLVRKENKPPFEHALEGEIVLGQAPVGIVYALVVEQRFLTGQTFLAMT